MSPNESYVKAGHQRDCIFNRASVRTSRVKGVHKSGASELEGSKPVYEENTRAVLSVRGPGNYVSQEEDPCLLVSLDLEIPASSPEK